MGKGRIRLEDHRNDDMFHTNAFHLACSCSRLPPDGAFTVGQEYTFAYMIDTVEIQDDLGQIIVFPEKVFESCFCDFADPVYPVTSFSPMLQDQTIYHLYFVLEQDQSNLEAIKACSKLMNVNYLQAKRILHDRRVLIATGDAYDMRELLHQLAHYQVQYEVSPPYPY